MKFVVFIVALAMQCVSTKSYGYGYFDEKFSVLEWITYLKRLSLIVLMLCSVLLYYVPKSRMYARKACCALIDLVANGLKYALIVTENECEKIKAIQQDEDKEPRIQELYRNKCEENIKNHGQRYINKIDFGDSNYKSVSKCEKRKSYTKPNSEEKHEERHSRRNHRHHQNVTFKNTWSESGATTSTYSDKQMEIIDKKYEKKNVTTLHDTSPKKMIHNVTDNKMNDSIDLQQEKVIRNQKDYTAENTETESSSSQKEGPSTVPEIIKKRDIEYKPMCENNDYRDCNYNSNYLSMTKQKHDKIADDCQRQSRNNYMKRIMNKQIARYDRPKPVLLRIVNWLFGGCPEASRRHQEQIDEVGKEEIFKSTNTWLL